MSGRKLVHLVSLIVIAVLFVPGWSAGVAEAQERRLVYRPYDVGEVDHGSPAPATPAAIQAGQRLYGTNCSRCHGVEGKGDGPTAYLMNPKPRNFAQRLYKLHSTPSGQLPTDADLYRTITLGMPGSGMPPWKGKLSQEERWQLVHYIKTLYPKWAEEVKREPLTPIGIPKPMPTSAASIQKGKEFYASLECAKCHGKTGKGDGPSANELKDDWGDKILPTDLTKPWFFRAGSKPEDIYRVLVAGVPGSPMPSWADLLPQNSDLWHVANYVLSLAEGQPPTPVLIETLKGPTLGVKAFESAAKTGSAAGKPEVVFDVVASGWEMWIMKDGAYLPRVNGLAQAGHEMQVKKGQVVQINFWPTENGLGAPYGHGFSIEGYDDRLFGLQTAAGPGGGSGAAYLERPLAYRFIADRDGEFPFYCSVQCDPGQSDEIKKLTGLWGHVYMGGTFLVKQ
ncbi:MAG: c-type cytochrome [Candidatus Tectomicrobia bacterium]|nr:c-type cytochrome [Candidatus Tectomicrobia bacterium]